jgi:hypothetical protein
MTTQPSKRKPKSVARMWCEIWGYALAFWLALGLILNYLFC